MEQKGGAPAGLGGKDRCTDNERNKSKCFLQEREVRMWGHRRTCRAANRPGFLCGTCCCATSKVSFMCHSVAAAWHVNGQTGLRQGGQSVLLLRARSKEASLGVTCRGSP